MSVGTGVGLKRRRRAPPVEWGKFGRLCPVARFLHLPVMQVRALRDLGLVPLRNGFITPEALRDAWERHAGQLGAGARTADSGQPSHPFTLLRTTAPRVGASGKPCAPLVYRPPERTGSEK